MYLEVLCVIKELSLEVTKIKNPVFLSRKDGISY